MVVENKQIAISKWQLAGFNNSDCPKEVLPRIHAAQPEPQPKQDPQHGGTEEAEGRKDTGRTRVRDAEHKDKAKPNHEERPEGCEERAKKIVAAEQPSCSLMQRTSPERTQQSVAEHGSVRSAAKIESPATRTA
jgi:hypothetical protein